MAAPTFVSELVAGKGNGSTTLNPGNSSVNNGVNLSLGSSGDVTILALVTTFGSNSEPIVSVTIGSGGGAVTLDASESTRTLGSFSTGTMRAFAKHGITLTGSQTYEVSTSGGAGFAIDVHFIVLETGTGVTYTAQADVLVNNGDTFTDSISSNADSLIVGIYRGTYKATTWTAGSGDTVSNEECHTFASIALRGAGSDGDVEMSPDATEVIMGALWSVENAGGGEVLAAEEGSFTLTGQAVTFGVSSAVSNGLLTFSGQDVTFTHEQPGVYSISIEPGLITFSAPESYSALATTLEPGIITFAGQDITGTLGEATDYTLSIDPGTIAFSGRSVNLLWSGAASGAITQSKIALSLKIGV